MHIVQPPSVRLLETNFVRIWFISRTRVSRRPCVVTDILPIIPKVEVRHRPGSTRILPFGLGRQANFPATLVRKLVTKLHGVFPTHVCDRISRPAPYVLHVLLFLPGSRAHHGFPLKLRDLRYSHVERLTYRNHMREFLRLVSAISLRRSHDEGAGWYEGCCENDCIGTAHLNFLVHTMRASRFFLPLCSFLGIKCVLGKSSTLATANDKNGCEEPRKHDP